MANEKDSSSQPQKPPSLLRLLADAVSLLFGSSSHVSDLRQESNEAHHPHDTTNKITQRREIFTTAPIRVAIDSIPPPKSPTDEEKADNEQERKDKILKNRLEVGATLIALGLLATNILLWCSTKKSANAARDAARIADATLKASNLANWRAQRAWVILSAKDPTTYSGPISLNMQIDNPGITEAKTFTGFATMIVLRNGEIPDLKLKRWKTQLDISVLVPKFHKEMPIGAYKDSLEREQWRVSEISDGLKTGKTALMIYGRFTYIDAWKVAHWIQFCSAAGGILSPAQSGPCTDYDQTDENEPQ